MHNNSHFSPSDLDQTHYSNSLKFGAVALLNASMKHINFLINMRTCLISRVFKIADYFRVNNMSPFCNTSNVPPTVDSFTPWGGSCHCSQGPVLFLPLQNCTWQSGGIKRGWWWEGKSRFLAYLSAIYGAWKGKQKCVQDMVISCHCNCALKYFFLYS